MKEEFKIGDYVKTHSLAIYDTNVPIGNIGRVVHLRHRYINTTNEYIQYRVYFEKYPELAINQTNCLYDSKNLQKLINY